MSRFPHGHGPVAGAQPGPARPSGESCPVTAAGGTGAGLMAPTDRAQPAESRAANCPALLRGAGPGREHQGLLRARGAGCPRGGSGPG